MNIDIHDYATFFLNRNFNIQTHHKPKIIVKDKLINDFDKLFFNFLNIISYNIPDHYNKTIEKKIKYEISHTLENFKFKLKNDVIENLCFQDNINLYTLSCLASYYKLNLVYYHETIYFKMWNNDESQQYYFVHFNKDMNCGKIEKLEHIYKNCYEIKEIHKPIYSLTFYKLEELKEICQQLNLLIHESKKYKKKDYYDLIKEYLINIIIK